MEVRLGWTGLLTAAVFPPLRTGYAGTKMAVVLVVLRGLGGNGRNKGAEGS